MPDSQVINWIIFAILAAYVALDAWAQGGITLRNRKFVPASEQPAINADHHVRLAACYALFVGAVALATQWWPWLLIGGLLRFGGFDAVLNRRKKDPLFSVGTSAWSDRLLGRAAFLNPYLRLLALLVSAAVLVWLPQWVGAG